MSELTEIKEETEETNLLLREILGEIKGFGKALLVMLLILVFLQFCSI